MPVLPDDKSTEVVRGQLLSGLEDINAAEWDKLIQKKQFGVLSAGFSYPIYAGGKIRSANRAADIRVQEAENEMEIMEYGLKRNMVVKYYGLVLATKAEQVRQEVYNTMKAHLRNAERMKEEGMIANAEYLHAKVYYSEANRELKKAKRDRQIVHDALINSLTLPDSVSLVAVSSLFYTDSLKSLSYFKEQVQNNSPLLEKVHYKRKLSEVNHHVEKGEFMPTIAAMGTYELANKDLSPYVPEYMIGVGLKWDLFKGASRYHNIKASRYQIQQVEHIYHQTITDLSTAITKFYQQSQMHLEQIHEIETSLEFANEYYRVRKKAYSEGMATTTEVSDASLAVAKAKIEKLKAIYEFDKALINLLYYSGLMNQLDEIREQSIKEDMTL
jgi:outer membrane protein TolC